MLWAFSFYTWWRPFALDLSKSCSRFEQDFAPTLLENEATHFALFSSKTCNRFPFISLLHRGIRPDTWVCSRKLQSTPSTSHGKGPYFTLHTQNYTFPDGFEHGFEFSTPFYPIYKSLVSFLSF